MPKLKLPYGQDAGHCYDRLTQQGQLLYQKGIADIRLAMESNNSFEQRLRKVLRLHAMTLQAAETEETSDEEHVYSCCLYDMLESMYNAEAERIIVSAGSYMEKRKNLDDLRASIARLPFGSVAYRNGTRPRLEKTVFQCIRSLEGKL
jgi:hypothetical protein